LQRALLLDVLLQAQQRRQARLDGAGAGSFALEGLLSRAAFRIGSRHALFQRKQFGFCLLNLVRRCSQVAGQLRKTAGVRSLQALCLRLEALASQGQLLQLPVCVTLGLRGQGQGLLKSCNVCPLASQSGSGIAQARLERRQGDLGVIQARTRFFGHCRACGKIVFGPCQLRLALLGFLVCALYA